MNTAKEYYNKLKEKFNWHKEKYDYEKYLAINPSLTKRMYDYLYFNESLWKIKCGKKVVIKYENEVLQPQFWLDTPANNENKYSTL